MLVLALCLLLVTVATVLVALGAVGASRHRAAVSGDLAALAAAARVLEGQGPACAAASRVAQAQGAELDACEVLGDVAEVAVTVRPAGPLGRLGAARASARAGPATAGAA